MVWHTRNKINITLLKQTLNKQRVWIRVSAFDWVISNGSFPVVKITQFVQKLCILLIFVLPLSVSKWEWRIRKICIFQNFTHFSNAFPLSNWRENHSLFFYCIWMTSNGVSRIDWIQRKKRECELLVIFPLVLRTKELESVNTYSGSAEKSGRHWNVNW